MGNELMKVTFKTGKNIAAVAEAIHTVLASSRWTMTEVKKAMERGEVSNISKEEADFLKALLKAIGAEDVKIIYSD